MTNNESVFAHLLFFNFHDKQLILFTVFLSRLALKCAIKLKQTKVV